MVNSHGPDAKATKADAVVMMIRASNFPVLLLISLYERQQYRDTTLMEQFGDFAERYVGSLPRRLKAAGKLSAEDCYSLQCDTDKIAGFENSRRDIGAVFEIEREVGSFYKGWDDDVDGDIDDDEPQLPILDLSDTEDKPSDGATEGNGKSPHDAEGTRVTPGPFTSSPAPVDSLRGRRSSMPSSPSPRPSPSVPIFQPVPVNRPRRNSSIHEPSPLARLFVSSPQNEPSKRQRNRRESMMQSLSISASAAPQILAGALLPVKRQHTRVKSLLPAPERVVRKLGHLVGNPSISTIEEGRKVSFRESSTQGVPFPPSPHRAEHRPLHKPARSRSPSIHEDAAGSSTLGVSIGKASDVVDELREVHHPPVRDEEWRERLEKIEKAQDRIEKLLSKLVSDKGYGDVFSEDER